MQPYPPRELWPDIFYSLPELSYPETLNACQMLLDANIEKGRSSAPAIYFKDSVLTYADVYQEVVRVAGALRQKGIEPGDRVVLRLLNRPHFLSTWLALLRIGAVVVATSPLIKAREIGAVIESAKPRLLIGEADLWEEVAKRGDARPPVLVRGQAVGGVESIDTMAESAPPYKECAPTQRDTLAIIGYTSGSTGVPKGCMHSHAALMATTDSYARYILQPAPDDRFGGHPTLAFTYGLGGLLLFPFRFGASTVLLDRFTPEAMLETIRKYKITIVFCAPTTYRLLLTQPAGPAGPGGLRDAVESLRLAVSAGETLPESLYRAWVDATGVEVLDGIGSTEMLHIFISGRPGHSRPGATGEVVPGYEAMVVDDNLQPVADGTPGLLAVKGPTGCRYLRLPDRQKEYVRSGWNIPGDIYIRDSDGFFHYQCRNDDLIICGGYNVAGPEVEGVLLEHPAVSEVAVVASPDELRGFVPKAFIVLSSTYGGSEELKKELQEFVKKEIAPYKYPRKIEFVRELPKTSTGKIRRTELRRQELQKGQVSL